MKTIDLIRRGIHVNGNGIHEITNLGVVSLGGTYASSNGPTGAVGSYDGVVPVDTNGDFTERSFTQPGLTNISTITNATHDEFYSGFVFTLKSLAVPTPHCPAGQTVPALKRQPRPGGRRGEYGTGERAARNQTRNVTNPKTATPEPTIGASRT